MNVTAKPNLEKRQRIMKRSMALGHCICDPRKPCPCDLFTGAGVCQCAGERLPESAAPVALTAIVKNPGCASKIDLTALRAVLAGLPAPADPRVLVGMPAGDDAGVYQVNENTTIVQTVDVFAASVDDPYTFGQIAAANSVSDIYAMGGQPLTALSIVGFPIRTVPDKAMHEILRGGIDKMTEAGVAVIGGHSINDEEVKAGFAVTGVVDPARIMTNTGARPGDALVLTKPLGTGILGFAAQIGRADRDGLEAAAQSMATLNKAAAEVMFEVGANACTDVTGFGLAGHLAAMAEASHVDVELVWEDIPLLPGVLACLGAGIIPGAVERNREFAGEMLTGGAGAVPAMLDLCLDAQTSGGLLISLPADRAEGFVTRLHAAGVVEACVVGRVSGAGTGKILLQTRGTRTIPEPVPSASGAAAPPEPVPAATSCCAPAPASPCCSSESSAVPAGAHGSGTAEIEEAFLGFLRRASRPGALDAHTKEAIALALSIYAKCAPCTEAHIRKARQMGFTSDEIDEAAWTAVAFGGSPVMMFYDQNRGDRGS